MKIRSAEFVTSAAAGGSLDGIPSDGLPQLAMAGRSNVGKSTLLNALCRRRVARTSAAPGKTRLANVYRLTVEGGGPGSWGLYLVDLPGYGYARGGADAAAEMAAVAEAYFAGSAIGAARDVTHAGSSHEPRDANPASRAALLLVDARHPGLDSDGQAAAWLAAMGVTHRVVATKIDKLSRNERVRHLNALEQRLGMPPLPVSAASGEGLDTLWKTIASLVRTGHG